MGGNGETDRDWIRPSSGRILVSVKVVPGSRKSEVAGLRDGRLLVRVAAPPEKGKANEELVDCLASTLGLRKAEIELAAGATSRLKTLSLPASAEPALRALASPSP